MAMQSGFIKRIRDIMRMDAGINGDAQRIEQMVWMLFLKVYDAKEDDWELNEDATNPSFRKTSDGEIGRKQTATVTL